jgi:hypothetical protein
MACLAAHMPGWFGPSRKKLVSKWVNDKRIGTE